jgi:large subunit ribosomal protein L10
LREISTEKEQQPKFSIIKNSLFNVAFSKFNKKDKLEASGQSAVMFLPEDWLSSLKAFNIFAKDQEGMQFRVGLIDGTLYEKDFLVQLANLPSKNELIAKILGSLKSPQTRIVYSLEFNMMKLVNVPKNAKGN